jgi:transcriptional regulator with XRE-family HTH domain
MINFSDKLRTALKAKGMTQGELCNHPRIKMTSTGFGRSVKNENLTIKQLIAISEILEVPKSYFLEDGEGQYETKNNNEESYLVIFNKKLNEDNYKLQQDFHRALAFIKSHGLNFLQVSRLRGVKLVHFFLLNY